MILNTSLDVHLAALLTKVDDFATVRDTVNFRKTVTLQHGTGADLADKLWRDERTLAGGASETLDLRALTDALGGAVAFHRLKVLLIAAAADNQQELVVGGGTITSLTGAAAHTIKVRPGGILLLVAPDATAYDVGAAAKGLKVAAGAGGATYDIALIGASA